MKKERELEVICKYAEKGTSVAVAIQKSLRIFIERELKSRKGLDCRGDEIEA